MNLGTIVVFIAPRFSHAAIGLFDALRREGHTFRVVGIGYLAGDLSGPEVVKRCGGNPDDFIDTDKLEKKWAAEMESCNDGSLDDEDWEEMARVRMADRQVGVDYVLGALPKHSNLIDLLRSEPWRVDHFHQRILQTCLDIEARYDPNLYALYCVAGGWMRGLEWAAEKHGKTIRSLNRFKLQADYFYWSEVFGRRYPERLHGRQADKATVSRVEQLLSRTADSGDPRQLNVGRKLGYRKEGRYPWVKISKAVLRGMTVSWWSSRVVRRDLWLRKKVVSGFEVACRLHNRWRAFRTMGALSVKPESAPYVFFPLHSQPEASTMVKAPWHTNQLALIEQTSKALPPGWKLVVKENYPAIGSRPSGFYDYIEGFHNVRLLPSNEDTGRWTDQSRLLLAITGTVAWEALIKGKPLVVVGEIELVSLTDHLVYEPDLSRLACAMQRALRLSPASHRDLAQFLAPLAEASFFAPRDCLWGEVTAQSAARNEEVYDEMASRLVDSLQSKESSDVGYPSRTIA